jgi:hypothetical protein
MKKIQRKGGEGIFEYFIERSKIYENVVIKKVMKKLNYILFFVE